MNEHKWTNTVWELRRGKLDQCIECGLYRLSTDDTGDYAYLIDVGENNAECTDKEDKRK